VLKVGISLALATLSYFFVEAPARRYLNRKESQRAAFGALAATLLCCVPLGNYLRAINYVNAEERQVKAGGLRYDDRLTAPLVTLMGDSNGSMYGRTVRDLSHQLGLRLHVISVAASSPIPATSGDDPPLWLESLDALRRDRPRVLIYVCLWTKFVGEQERLTRAIDSLVPLADHVVLITQPPERPDSGTREAIRSGSRAPFTEAGYVRGQRNEVDALVRALRRASVTVIDIEDLFTQADGSVRIQGDDGQMLYQDRTHLSGAGADLVAERLRVVLQASVSRASTN